MKVCVKFLIVFLLLITPVFAQDAETLQEATQNSEQTQEIQQEQKQEEVAQTTEEKQTEVPQEKTEDKQTEEKQEKITQKENAEVQSEQPETIEEKPQEKVADKKKKPQKPDPKAKQKKPQKEEKPKPPAEDPELALFKMVKEYSEREEVLFWKEEFLKERRFKFMRKAVEEYPEYRIFVRKTVREMGLPAELEYLPVIESGYNIKARSRSGAVGMWQFMSNSVRPYLKLTEYLDERYDPWKSTVAGLSKLQDNYKIFEDWLLAIAAYNCGNGKMRSAIKKSGGEKDFWVLAREGYLPKQTADYIPELLAVAEICTNPKKFEVELAYYREEFDAIKSDEENYDFVTVKKPYMLASIAKEIQIEEAELKKLNPAYTKGFTQPFGESVLRLPKGMQETFDSIVANLKEVEIPFKYKVVKGDSLWSIARRYGVTVKLICDTNGIKESALLQLNQILYIPAVK